MLARIRGNWNPCALLVGMWAGAGFTETSTAVPQKTRQRGIIQPLHWWASTKKKKERKQDLRCLSTQGQSSIMNNSQKVNENQVSVNTSLNKQNVRQTSDDMLFHLKKRNSGGDTTRINFEAIMLSEISQSWKKTILFNPTRVMHLESSRSWRRKMEQW